MNRRRALAAVAGLAALPLLAACPGGNRPANESHDSEPKCDFDDLLEGDKDCDLKSSKKPASDTKPKPKPRRTKRP